MLRRPVMITSVDNPRVKRVVQLRKQRERRDAGLFVSEGVREVTRAADAGLVMRAVFVCPAMLGDAHDAVVGAADAEADLYEVGEAVLRKMAYREHPEGVLAVFEQRAWSLADVERLITEKAGAPLLLVAVGLHKPGNLGAIARSADAAGADALLVADAMVDAYNPNAIRASAGAVFALPVVGQTSQAVRAFLLRQGVTIIATSPDAEAVYSDADLSGPTAIVIGAEDTGLSGDWLADEAGGVRQVRVPMRGRVTDSLNASVAAGVLLFEAARQRGERRKSDKTTKQQSNK